MKSNRLWVLVKGELMRLHKYSVTSISILIALMWGGILYFLDTDVFNTVLPLILLVDASMMSIMYIGSVMFFEKTESTISTMLVTPTTNSELVISKVLANVIHNILSSMLIVIAFVLIKDIQLNWFGILLGIFLATAFHTILGLYMAYYQKNFTGMLVNMMTIVFLLMIPTVLFELNVIKGAAWEYILLINPMQSAAEIINGGFAGYVVTWKYFFAIGYMLFGSIILYFTLVLPKFQDYAIKQSGV